MRLLRLIRLIRAARLVRKIVDESNKVVVWVPPARYANVTSEEAETIVSMLKVLSMIYDRILDKNLGVCVSAFVEWMEENNTTTSVNPMTILRKVKENNDDLLPSIPDYFDDILLDILMYKDTVLTHSLTHSLTHFLTYLLTHSITHSLTYSLTHSLTHCHSLTHSLTHSLLLTHYYSLTYSLTHSLTHSLTITWTDTHSRSIESLNGA